VSAQVIQLPRRDGHDPELTYPQLVAHFGVSKRLLQMCHAEGMPSCGFDYTGRKLFRLSVVAAALDARQERMGRTMGGARSPVPSQEEVK
jgi:hypothetical protein